MDIGTAKPSRRPSGPRCRTTASTWSNRPTTSRSPSSRLAHADGARRDRSGRRRCAAGRAARACTTGSSSTTSTSRGSGRTFAPNSRRSTTRRRCTSGSPRSDPAAAAKIEPNNRRRIVRALEVTIGSGRPFSSFGPGVDAYPRHRRRPDRPPTTATRADRTHRRTCPSDDRSRPRRRGAIDRRRSGVLANGGAGARLQGNPRAPGRVGSARMRRSQRSSPAPASSPSARTDGSAVIHAYAGSTSSTIRWPKWFRPFSTRSTNSHDDDDPPDEAPRARQRLPRAARCAGRGRIRTRSGGARSATVRSASRVGCRRAADRRAVPMATPRG